MDPENVEKGRDGQPLYTTAEEAVRYDMLMWFYKDLCEMAITAMQDPVMQAEGFAMVCVQSCDRWEDLIEMLEEEGEEEPEYETRTDPSDTDEDMQEAPYEGMTGLFTIYAETIEDIVEEIPEQEATLTAPVPAGLVQIIILNETGCSIYYINPKPQRMH